MDCVVSATTIPISNILPIPKPSYTLKTIMSVTVHIKNKIFDISRRYKSWC